jgi:hypothetical protein
MNLKLKVLVAAAVATITMSGVANAIPTSDLVLVAFDATKGTTFTADLGAVSAFNNTSLVNPINFNTGVGSNWANFFAASTAANIQYQVLGATATSLLSTSNDIVQGNDLNAALTTALTTANAGGTYNLFLANNPGTTNFIPSSPAGTLGVGDNIGFNWSSNFSFTTGAALDQNNSFYTLTKGLNSLGKATANTPLNAVAFTQSSGINSFWNLSSNGVLNYTGVTAVAAVPETDSRAMALLGLGFMGFLARRRSI